jgi:ABC-2 type transport system ATP-binding protein
MDEAQHLADRVVVINRGEIVASGTPETIGGRAKAAARIRFNLPPGVEPPVLAVPLTRDGSGALTLETHDEVRALHALTSWALDRDVELIGLTVDRPSLEDVYIELTSTDVTQ